MNCSMCRTANLDGIAWLLGNKNLRATFGENATNELRETLEDGKASNRCR
jgi:hypothetical protein